MSLPAAALRWMRNRRPPRPASRRIAGVLATRNYDDRCGVFATLAALSDVTIVLDDNADVPFVHRDRCTEYLALRNQGPWNAPANLTLLLYRAFVHGCDWVLSLDDDIVLSHGLQRRADVDALVGDLERRRIDICHLPLRDLWNGVDRYRADGRWRHKTFAILRRNWFFFEGLTLRDPAARLHTAAFPASLRPRWTIDRRHAAYHAGCMTAADRTARVEKYAREDPDNRFQDDYTYLLDERALDLQPVPAGDLAVIRARLSPEDSRRQAGGA